VRQVERAEVFGDLDAHPVVVHLESGLKPALVVLKVGTAGAETLMEGLRLMKLAREVQKRREHGGRLRVRTLGTDADVGRP